VITITRSLVTARCIESYFALVSEFLDKPPITRRVRDASVELSQAMGRDFIGALLPGYETAKTVLDFSDHNAKKRKIITVATSEYERFLRLEDDFDSLDKETTAAASAVSRSVNDMGQAYQNIQRALKLLTHTIDINKVTSRLQVEMIKLLHKTTEDQDNTEPADI